MNTITYRPMQPDEAQEVSDLIMRVFNEFVAPGYAPEGVQEFLWYVQPAALLKRAKIGTTLVACVEKQVVGIIQMKEISHVSLLFVDKAFQRKGISSELLNRAIAICRRDNPAVAQITLNSSPYALPIYEKLGFRPTGPEQVTNGVRSTPMVLEL
jgi:GNAT superfamily N-acetyltransferase